MIIRGYWSAGQQQFPGRHEGGRKDPLGQRFAVLRGDISEKLPGHLCRGGDLFTGPSIAVEAVAAGQQAAVSIKRDSQCE